MLDRYTKVVLTVIALTLAALPLTPFLLTRVVAAGQPLPEPNLASASNPRKADVPRSWGRLVAASDHYLFFEASDGTIRNYPTGSSTWTEWARK